MAEPAVVFQKREKWKWRAMGVFIFLFAGAFVLAWVANQNRIHDIQHARVHSCMQTYEGIREVFNPFKPDKKHMVGEQKKNWYKLNSTIDELKKKCEVQTQVKTTPN